MNLKSWLNKNKLGEFAQALIDEEGFLELEDLVGLSTAEINQIVSSVDGAKRGQKLRILRLLRAEESGKNASFTGTERLGAIVQPELPPNKQHHFFISHKSECFLLQLLVHC